MGSIEEVIWRTTRIRTEDNSRVIMPNGSLGSTMITNHRSHGRESRFDVSFWLDFSVAHDRARRVLLGAVRAVAGRGPILDWLDPQITSAAFNAMVLQGGGYCLHYARGLPQRR